MMPQSRKLNREQLPPEYCAILEQRIGTKETDVLAVELAAPEESQRGGTATLERPKTKFTRQTDKAYYAEKANRITKAILEDAKAKLAGV